MKRIVLITLVIVSVCGAAMGYAYNKCWSKRWRYDKPVISRYPDHLSRKGNLRELPKYKNTMEGKTIYNPYQLDIRGMNLSGIDLSGRLDDLMHSKFDNMTIWPEKLPQGFEPVKIIRTAKKPGLGLDRLHNQGIDGKNVSIAVIGLPLFLDHAEYMTNLRLYDEVGSSDIPANDESSKIVSIILGKTGGAAPNADLFYISAGSYQTGIKNNPNSLPKLDCTSYVKAIDKIVKINKNLPDSRRIRAVYINGYFSDTFEGYKEFLSAVDKANSEGIFVITNLLSAYSSIKEKYGVDVAGLGRKPELNPDLTSSYSIPILMEDMWEEIINGELKYPYGENVLLLPMDSLRTAYVSDAMNYAFYTMGTGCEPSAYAAGVYALACQVFPDITPEIFLKEALDTGDVLKVERDGKKIIAGKIINPQKLIEKLKDASRTRY